MEKPRMIEVEPGELVSVREGEEPGVNELWARKRGEEPRLIGEYRPTERVDRVSYVPVDGDDSPEPHADGVARMERLLEVRDNKSLWGDGPWLNEPDRLEWRSKGYPCLIVRAQVTGALCGYVAVPPGHPWHGKGYDDVNHVVRVHGGLTYADSCEGNPKICHVPEAGEPDNVWWLGFDCSHHMDCSPAMRATIRECYENFMPSYAEIAGISRDVVEEYRREHEVYRDIEYVKAEVESLVVQAHANRNPVLAWLHSAAAKMMWQAYLMRCRMHRWRRQSRYWGQR
jgi:hypothetical protein